MILITGGTGYIGSHSVLELLARGKDLLILDNLSSSNLRACSRSSENHETGCGIN